MEPPRGRGKVIVYITAWRVAGITPARRGKVDVLFWGLVDGRITPAQAGKRGSGLLFHRVWWDHPRVGGEKSSQKGCGSCPAGSPPHGRGKASFSGISRPGVGITPAWAGKSLFCFAAAVPIQDHPRVGGEKLMPPLMGFWLRGSPPRGRGKAELSAAIDHVLGITPAYAGKRRRISCSPTRSRDHPRMGGEKLVGPNCFRGETGITPA